MPRGVPRDLTGQMFGRWLVVEECELKQSGKRMWLCECVCGATTEVQAGNLTSGNSKGCRACYITQPR